jgi:hypothetical protein
MTLRSPTLRGNARLEQAALGPPSIKPRPAVEDPDAIARIQRGLVELGFLPAGFGADPLGAEPLGVYGPTTTTAVKALQRAAFPSKASEWDGLVGRNTVRALDARLAARGGGGAPPPPADEITQVLTETQAFVFGYVVPDPVSVAELDARTRGLVPFRYVTTSAAIHLLKFRVLLGGRVHWVGAAVPAGLTDFTQAHVFFHPAPGQAGIADSQYDAFTGGWVNVERYVPWIGSQLAAAGREQVLFVPYLRGGEYFQLGLLGSDPIARITALLSAAQQALHPGAATAPTLKVLGASSFSVGVAALSRFIARVGGTGLLREAYDFDGLYSNSADKMIARIPGGVFRKYAQSAGPALARNGVFLAPQPRWRNHPDRPVTGNATHALMPNLFFHAAWLGSD